MMIFLHPKIFKKYFTPAGTIPSVRLGDKILIPKADIINFFMLNRKDYDNEQDKETRQKS